MSSIPGVGKFVEPPAARAAEPEASWITVPVERRVLLSSTVVTRVDVEPQEALVVGAPSSVEGDEVVEGDEMHQRCPRRRDEANRR
jgi:hypothetical protein